MYCPKCGNNTGTDRFCSKCGYHMWEPPVQPPVPGNLQKPPQNKNKGKYLPFLILAVVLMWGAIGYFLSQSGTTDNSDSENPSEEETFENAEEAWLAFDERTWSDFVKLYTAHNNLMNALSAFSNGNLSMVDFYQYCEDARDYFASMSLTFNYATSEDENDYLSAFEYLALSDQRAAESLMKYLDSQKTSDLSSAEESIENAKSAITTIASNRGTLLVKAGLSQEEIQERVEQDMADLE